MQKPDYVPNIVIPEFEDTPPAEWARTIIYNDLPNALASGLSGNRLEQIYRSYGLEFRRQWFQGAIRDVTAQLREMPGYPDFDPNKAIGDVGRAVNDYNFSARYREVVYTSVYNQVTGEVETRGHVVYHNQPMTPQELIDATFDFYHDTEAGQSYQLTILSANYAEAYINKNYL